MAKYSNSEFDRLAQPVGSFAPMAVEDENVVGARLRALRLKRGLRQEDLARMVPRRLSVTQRSISRWESGGGTPQDREVRVAIATALGVPNLSGLLFAPDHLTPAAHAELFGQPHGEPDFPSWREFTDHFQAELERYPSIVTAMASMAASFSPGEEPQSPYTLVRIAWALIEDRKKHAGEG